MTTPFFMTHHAPVGAWSSLTFGLPGRGMSIDHETLKPEPNADLLVALHRDGVTTALPFIEKAGDYSGWRVLGAEALTRTLTPCVDTFAAESAGITLKVFTPHAALPNPKRSGNLQYSTVPGVLFELSIDNSGSGSEATAFIGLKLHGSNPAGTGSGRLRALDWSSKTLRGVGIGSKWVFAASAGAGEGAVTTVLSEDVAGRLASGEGEIALSAAQGGVMVKVPAGAKKTLHLVFAFYDQGNVTQGIDGRYMYTVYFPRVEAVANFVLANAQKILESCASFDGRATSACGDATKLAIFSQAVRAYEANTQLVDGGTPPAPYFTVIEGEAGYRNALSAAVDHLPWELYRNPWVVRNIFDLATTSYAYQDRLKFPGDAASPEELRTGGMTFVHDFGYHTSYTPNGVSAYETAGMKKGAGLTATEDLLNGVYLLTSYALLADDTPWAKTRLPFARELMENLENRDHWDPEKRTGVVKGQSERAGSAGEVSALAALGGELGGVAGNLYIAVKTFCANMMLTTYYQSNNDLHSADYSYAFAQKTAQSIVAAFDAGAGMLPANLLSPDTSAGAARLIAALEPLAIPTYLGLTTTLPEYFPELFNALKAHAMTCLKNSPEGCVDAVTGGLRLASTSAVVLPAKVVNVLYVLERLFGIDVQGTYPSLWREVAAWCQSGGSGTTAAEVVDAGKRAVLSNVNSPRLVSSALYVKPVVVAQPAGA